MVPWKAEATWSLSSARGITWQGNVGVEGNIPERTNIYVALGDSGQAPSYAQSVTSGDIQTALNECPSGYVVFLNTGTYTFNTTVSIPSNKTLRGAGMDNTILTGQGNTGVFYGSAGNMIQFYGGGYTNPDSLTTSNIGATYTVGSTSITLADASAFPSTGFVFVDQLNDASIPVVTNNFGDGVDWTNARSFAVLHKITGKAGNTLSIDPPAIFTFTSAKTPRAIKVQPTYVQNAGIEHLTIKNLNSSHIGIGFFAAANCWAYKVKVQKFGKYGVWLYLDTFRNTIRQCYFTDAYDFANTDHYPVFLSNVSSFNLVESNLLYSVPDGIITQSCSGNVIAYNYFHTVHKTTNLNSWFWRDTHCHQAHIAKTLWEGNYGTGLTFDEVGGSNSHNIAFRNRFTGYDESTQQNAATENHGCVVTWSTSGYNNIVGNVLGKSGESAQYEDDDPYNSSTKNIYCYEGGYAGVSWTTQYRHRNYNYLTDTIKDCGTAGEPGCQSESEDTTLPDSLYLSSKPAWFGSQTYPPVDPTSPALTDANRLPAKVFYDTGSWPEEAGEEESPPVNPSSSTVRAVFH